MMICPYCNADTQVTNSRSHNKARGVWRRRQCKQCGALWTTTESYDLSTTHRIAKPHLTAPEAFNRDILFTSIKDSLAHRKDATTDASALTDTIISKVLACREPLIPVGLLVQVASETLEAFDPIASAVYQAKNKQ